VIGYMMDHTGCHQLKRVWTAAQERLGFRV
jgi:hypothetical protein